MESTLAVIALILAVSFIAFFLSRLHRAHKFEEAKNGLIKEIRAGEVGYVSYGYDRTYRDGISMILPYTTIHKENGFTYCPVSDSFNFHTSSGEIPENIPTIFSRLSETESLKFVKEFIEYCNKEKTGVFGKGITYHVIPSMVVLDGKDFLQAKLVIH